jgi:uncharacterized protein YutE (UPF0331/DUF86 family)
VSSKLKISSLSPQLDTIARCIERIESKRPFSEKDLKEQFDLQDIVSINLERVVQAALNIAAMIIARSSSAAPLESAQYFEVLKDMKWIDSATCERMKKAVGFRNLMVHEYEKVDWAIVYKVATIHLDDFRKFSSQIIKKVE